MAKLMIILIMLFVNFMLVGSENITIYESNNPGANPSIEEVESVFDLMFVIILFLIAEKIPLGIAATFLNFMLQLFVCAISYLFIIKAYQKTNDFFFIQYLIAYSVFTLFSIPSYIYFMYRAIVTITYLHYFNDSNIGQNIKQEEQKDPQLQEKLENLKRSQLSHMYHSFLIQFTIYVSLFIANMIFFIVADFHNYIYRLSFLIILLPSLIFILFTIIEVICAAIFDIDEITELKDLEERVTKLEHEIHPDKSLQCKTPEYGKYMNYVVGFHDRIKNRRIMVKVIGICSYFLFCTITAPDSLWTK
ncbi:21243_t:CDS:2, partial [Gigaspora rosea]